MTSLASHLLIFQCDYSAVFCNVSVATVATDVKFDWHFAKRKVSGTWVNTGMVTQIWKTIAEGAKYQNAVWVMRLDADAIFVLNRMRA